MKAPSLKRLNNAFSKFGLKIDQSNDIYRIFSDNDANSYLAEVLLPLGYPLEKKAVQQLISFATSHHPSGGEVKAAFATPDFHTGTIVPVGAVVATTQNMIIPQAIGTDIHCGMRLHTCDITYEEFAQNKAKIIEKLKGDLLFGTRDIPMRISGFQALFEQGLLGWLDETKKNPLGQLRASNFEQILNEIERVYSYGSETGAIKWAPEYLIDFDREVIRDSYLATIGGGNHFIEIQIVEKILDRKLAFQWGIKEQQLAVMIHTGSRSVGSYVGNLWIDKAKQLWPKGVKHPNSGIYPVYGEQALNYLAAMNTASNYANLNRLLLAEMVRLRMREVFNQNVEMPLIYDAPHNTITVENDCFIHRKGATPAYSQQPVLIPGSMGQASYLMAGLGNKDFLQSASHGAGRALSRNTMFKKHHKGEDIGLGCVNCITLKEERMIEEAPYAYKSIDDVIKVQMDHKIVSPVAKLKPILTFKG